MELSYIGYGILAIALGVLIWVTIGTGRKTWYKVYLANGDVLLLCRDRAERWWRTSDRYMRFKDETGREITFPSNAHWVLMWEEIPAGKLQLAREEVTAIKNKQRMAQGQ